MAGGVCWVAFAWFAALSPPYGTAGNVGNQFVTEDAWLLAALPLLASGAWALDRAHRQTVTRIGRVGAALFVAGAGLATASLALEALGILVMERPVVQIGAQVVLIPVGGTLLAWGALRGRTVPAPVAGLLLGGAVLLLIANSENWMAGLAAVFGLGWIAVGAYLMVGQPRPQPADCGSGGERAGRRKGRR